jgi:hypothetical protein
MPEIKRYRQTKKTHWLKTPEGTIWKTYGFGNYIQPEDEDLWETPFGVDLDLLFGYPDEFLFKLIKEEADEIRITAKIVK